MVIIVLYTTFHTMFGHLVVMVIGDGEKHNLTTPNDAEYQIEPGRNSRRIRL